MQNYFTFCLIILMSACSDVAKEPVVEVESQDVALADSFETTEIVQDVPFVDTILNTEIIPDQINEFVDIDWSTYEEEMTRDYSFVILISTKSYQAAVERAEEASQKLGYPLNLRGLHENQEIGLSFSKEVCEEEICGGGLDYPIYIPRSDWGDSKYISIEYSNNFEGFAKGYYIVVAASGEKGNPVIEEVLKDARVHYEDAYAKTCGVWMGCGC